MQLKRYIGKGYVYEQDKGFKISNESKKRPDDIERKKIMIHFEDIFGKNIKDWQMLCREKIVECSDEQQIAELFDFYMNRTLHRESDKTFVGTSESYAEWYAKESGYEFRQHYSFCEDG